MNLSKIANNRIARWFYCVYLAARYKGGLLRKAKFFHFARIVSRKGVVWFRIERLAKDYTDAWYAMSSMPEDERRWYIEHGFSPAKKVFYGVGPDNYKSYLSDFEFYRKENYKNSKSSSWFDDKLNTYFLLQPFKDYLPRHYYYARGGVMYPLDVDAKFNHGADDVLSLVKTREIAAKKCLGGHGEGFYKLSYSDGAFYANDKECSEEKMRQLLAGLKGYLITDFVKPAHYLREIVGEDSFAVMRVMAIYDPEDGPRFERTMIRLGTAKAGHTQAMHDHIYAGIDENGRLYDPILEKSDYDFRRIKEHPDTGKEIEGCQLKNMEQLRELVKRISGYLPMTPYLIFDIIPTDESFSILEINSHGQPFIFEPFGLVKSSKYFTKLFKTVE